jgi:hypothetical protein
MVRMGGSMGNRQSESLADKRRRRERMSELDDLSTLCFPQKKISNMEAKDEAKDESQGPQRQTMGKTDMETQSRQIDLCCECIKCVVFTGMCVVQVLCPP